MPEPNDTTKIQAEATKIQTASTAAKSKEGNAPKTVQEADAPKEIKAELKPKYIPTSYTKQELGDAEAQEDGTVVREVKLSEPVVPKGETVDDRYKTQTQKVTYRNNKRIGCEILDAAGKPLSQVNTALLDG